MNPLAIVRSLFAFALVLVAAPAQQLRQRFHLPDPPYDYTEVAMPDGLERFVFRDGDDPAGRESINRRAALGRVLFHDPLLSKNRSVSCASCHEQRRAFADGRAKSTGFRGGKTKRNSMSIVDLAGHRGFFWDARAESLEAMVLMPIQDPVEMGLGLVELRGRLRAEPAYAELFVAAFGNDDRTTEQIGAALATFVRSIRSLQSKYDVGYAAAKRVDVDFPNFTAAENRGKRLFFGDPSVRDRSCAECHVRWRSSGCGSYLGTPDVLDFATDGCRNNGVDDGRGNDDVGLAGVTKKLEDRGKFRAPSLRNVELTAPYMHDGRFAKLDDVVAFYASRMHAHPQLDAVFVPGAPGGWGPPREAGRPLPAAASPIVGDQPGFQLTRREQDDLVAFLKTLTDHELVRDPRFSDPFAKPRAQ